LLKKQYGTENDKDIPSNNNYKNHIV